MIFDKNAYYKNKNGNGSAEEEEERITVKVISQLIDEIYFRVKMDTKLSRLKTSYCDRVGVPVNSLRFFFNGCDINDDDTPTQLDMKEFDLILAYQEGDPNDMFIE